MNDFAPFAPGRSADLLPGSKKKSRFVSLAAFLLSWIATSCGLGQDAHSIINSKHNLSLSGPGTIRSATEGDICIFCHSPHSLAGQSPLWNHEMSVAPYTPYSSSTLKATVGQPTGASKLCLSCHDGTVALGMVDNRLAPIVMQSGATTVALLTCSTGQSVRGSIRCE